MMDFAVTAECCDEPTESCSGGKPSSCNTGCAAVLLPFFADCGAALGKAQHSYDDVVAQCYAASTGRK